MVDELKSKTPKQVIVVGGGLSGLIAARRLQRLGAQVTVLESKDRIGGRIQTDSVDGFLLDHGFQVYLTAYETAGTELDLSRLNLKCLPPGAFIQMNSSRYRIGDPLRCNIAGVFKACWGTLFAPIGSLNDKWRVLRYRNQMRTQCCTDVFQESRVSAKERLVQFGFSPTIIERFFRPFFAGIFLDPNLEVASDRMDFVFRAFSLGYAALPEQGMQAIPNQIAQDLLPGTIQLNKTVGMVKPGEVRLSDGKTLSADAILLAVEQPSAERLLGNFHSAVPVPRSSCTLYYAVPETPIREATLILNGTGDGPVNHHSFVSESQPSYAPEGFSLLSVSTVGWTETWGEDLESIVREQLTSWYGTQVSEWAHLRTYRIPYSLPNQSKAALAQTPNITVGGGIYRCGDYCVSGSIEGAIQSGIAAANRILSL